MKSVQRAPTTAALALVYGNGYILQSAIISEIVHCIVKTTEDHNSW